jgi:L,D-transpeptidase catalytic domain
MFLSVLLVASVDKAEVTVEHPELAFRIPAIFGKPSTPTPVGVYLVKKGYSKKLDMRILIFRRDDSGVYAIHPNLKSRNKYLDSPETVDNKLSAGCIGISDKYFDLLWTTKQPIVLQVY